MLSGLHHLGPVQVQIQSDLRPSPSGSSFYRLPKVEKQVESISTFQINAVGMSPNSNHLTLRREYAMFGEANVMLLS